ncbi:hypothetical protein A2419_00415 [Candidatus Adlerbacteria bacterium RIFOXYC1_FULL_48_26]|uniref:Uncharacterized protein n=1 Tax=Candidatus Adlerbacteria bacterium RIFOXYC1_FULL_48_26 TaxID=1797247 RepID=A0A1F4Y2X7_9BACT|nr:MAG: hypothetical protein A2419_00415 [Candidatus Adlerbacteria bacterium RIFOXYC1_FULL_48_26]
MCKILIDFHSTEKRDEFSYRWGNYPIDLKFKVNERLFVFEHQETTEKGINAAVRLLGEYGTVLRCQ